MKNILQTSFLKKSTELLHSQAKKRFTQIEKELSRLTKRSKECELKSCT